MKEHDTYFSINFGAENTTPESRAKDFSKVFSHFANCGSSMDFKAAIDILKYEHRTLQQGMAGFCLRYLYALAEHQERDIDLRNEAAVAAAKKVKEALGEFGDSLPLI